MKLFEGLAERTRGRSVREVLLQSGIQGEVEGAINPVQGKIRLHRIKQAIGFLRNDDAGNQ